jgi:glycosyltransferase involved in cell wall biosynthesis
MPLQLNSICDRARELNSTISLSVIMPIYNEEEILPGMLEALSVHFDRVIGRGAWQFVMVNNGSSDRTGEIIEHFRARWPSTVSVSEASPNYGLALRAGVGAASAPWLHLIDVEQWDIPFLNWAWRNREKYDLFIGSKRADPTLNRQHALRRFLSWGLNALLQFFFEFSGTDTHGPKLINRATLQPVLDRCVMDRGQYDTEIVLRSVRAGLRIVEAPIPYVEKRPPRNTIVLKVIWNLIAMNRMRYVMRDVPFRGPVRIWRVTREDLLAVDSAQG